MSVRLLKILAALRSSKDESGDKVLMGVMAVTISPLIAFSLLIGGIFSDGINFNHSLITDLFNGTLEVVFSGEKAEYISEIQHGLSLIDREINETNELVTNGAILNVYQVKGYYIGLMFSSQHLSLNETTAKKWVESFTTKEVKEEETVIRPISVNPTIYSQLEGNLSITLNSDTRAMMEKVYGGLIGNSNGTVTTLSPQEIQQLLNNLPEDTSQLRKDLVIQGADAVGKIPYYWGGSASVPGYEGNNFGTIVSPDEKGRNRKGMDCSHFIDWVYWTVMNNNLGNVNTTGQIKLCRSISAGELLPGDLAFLMDKSGNTTHVGMYAGRNEKGEMVWIHENAHDCNVAINTVSYWSGYYRLNFMEGR